LLLFAVLICLHLAPGPLKNTFQAFENAANDSAFFPVSSSHSNVQMFNLQILSTQASATGFMLKFHYFQRF